MLLTLATQNEGKLRELEALISGQRLAITARSLAQSGATDQAEETGCTFGQNALLKAEWAARRTSGWALADDSGLCVDALGGAPGIHSARWSGGGDAANNALLLEKLAGIPVDKRGARYRCALALCDPLGEALLVEAEVEGRITEAPRGAGGFGYDPLFEIPAWGRTLRRGRPRPEGNALAPGGGLPAALAAAPAAGAGASRMSETMSSLESRAWRWAECQSHARAALLLGLCAFLLMAAPGIGNLDGLGHSDEHFYLSIAADTYDTGHIAPTHDGGYVFQKPPLVFWIARLCMAVLGRSGTAARLPGAIAAALLVAAGTLFTAEVAGAAVAPLAGAFLLGSLGLARFDRVLMLDLPLSACLGWALWAGPPERCASPAGLHPSSERVSRGTRAPCLAIKGLPSAWPCFRSGRADCPGPRAPVSISCAAGRFWVGVGLGCAWSAPGYIWALATHPHEFFAFHIQEQYLSRFESDHGQSRWNLLLGTLLYAAPFWPFAAVAAFRTGAKWPLLAPAPCLERVRWPWVAGWLLAFYGIFLLPKEHGLHYPLLVLIPLGDGRRPPRPIALLDAARRIGSRCCAERPSLGGNLWRFPRSLASQRLSQPAGDRRAAADLLLSGSHGRVGPGRIADGGGGESRRGLAGGPVFGRPLLSPAAAAELGRHEPVALFSEHSRVVSAPGGLEAARPRRCGASGRSAMPWSEAELILCLPTTRFRGAPPPPAALVARLKPVAEMAVTRPLSRDRRRLEGLAGTGPRRPRRALRLVPCRAAPAVSGRFAACAARPNRRTPTLLPTSGRSAAW